MARPTDVMLVILSLNASLGTRELKPSSIGRAARFINHLDNLPDVGITPDHDVMLTVSSTQKDNVDSRYNLRKSSKAPTKLKV